MTAARSRPGSRVIKAGEFKAVCLRLMEQVRETGREFVITKRGEPVAKLGPVTDTGLLPFVGRSRGVITATRDALMAWPPTGTSMVISDLGVHDRLILGTHVWVWASGEAGGTAELEGATLRAIEQAARSRRLFASAACISEIALKSERGLALVSGDLHAWVREQCRYPGVRVVSIGKRLAVDCTRLPTWTRQRDGLEHRDPSDRFLVTTARRLNAVLLTRDAEILAYARQGHVKAFAA